MNTAHDDDTDTLAPLTADPTEPVASDNLPIVSQMGARETPRRLRNSVDPLAGQIRQVPDDCLVEVRTAPTPHA